MVDDGKGGKVEWQVEGRAPGVLLRAGWTKTSLKPGETVTVDMSPAKDGTQSRHHRAGDQGGRHHPVQPAGAAVKESIDDAQDRIVDPRAAMSLSARELRRSPVGPERSGRRRAPPDFSGVYYPVQRRSRRSGGRRAGAPPAGAQRGGPPPRPTQSAPLSDGSQGRSPDAPSLTPEYMAKWEVMRKSRIAGSYEFDNNAKCLPPGHAGHDEHGVRHGSHADEGQDHVLQRAERRAAARVPGRPQADAEDSGRSDVRRLLDRTLGRRHAGRRHGGAAPRLRSSRASRRTATR